MRPSDVIELKKLMAVMLPVLKGDFDEEIARLEAANAQAMLLGDLKKREEAQLEKESAVRAAIEQDEKLLEELAKVQVAVQAERKVLAEEKKAYKVERDGFIAEQAAKATELETGKAELVKAQNEFYATLQKQDQDYASRTNELGKREAAIAEREAKFRQAAAELKG